MKENCMTNRAKLVDVPVVIMLMTNRFSKSDIKFMMSDNESDFDIMYCYSGNMRSLKVRRNSAKHYKSSNFSVSINKNNLAEFSNSTFAFIDEVANAIYLVDGVALLQYMIDHSAKVNMLETNSSMGWIIIPKKDILNMISDNPNSIIKYNNAIAKILENGRNELMFKDLL